MALKICVLIPSYNEAKTIGSIVKELRRKDLSVYVIDDGSSDNTAALAKAEGGVVIKHQWNRGKGASIIEGFRHFIKKDYDAVIIMDGDGQHKVEDIGNFIKKLEETNADMIIGNRMSDTSTMPYVRIQTNRFMSHLLSFLSGQKIPDSQCGFKLIKRKVLERIKLESARYDIESELIIKASRAGFKIESVPVKTIYQGEESKINPFLDTLRFFAFLIRISFKK